MKGGCGLLSLGFGVVRERPERRVGGLVARGFLGTACPIRPPATAPQAPAAVAGAMLDISKQNVPSRVKICRSRVGGRSR